jgi:hypothetical protein
MVRRAASLVVVLVGAVFSVACAAPAAERLEPAPPKELRCEQVSGTPFRYMPRLTVVDDQGHATKVPVLRDLTIGEPQGMTIRLTELGAGCSARLRKRHGQLLIEPVAGGCALARGTTALTACTAIAPGDVIAYGSYMLTFSDEP